MAEDEIKGTQRRNNSASLRRALAILLELGSERPDREITIADLSKSLGFNKSTVLRLMQPMIETQFIEHGDNPGSYRLGWRNAYLGQSYLAGMSLERDMHDVLVHLTQQTKETSHLVRHAQTMAIYIDKVDSPLAVRMFSRVGNAQPLHSTSVGKCILAHADESLFRMVFDAGVAKRTPATITSEKAMRTELERIRVQGWAIDDIENEEGIRCVAAPVFDADGNCTHAVSVSGPVSRVTKSRVSDLAPLVVEAAKEISRRNGARRRSLPG